MLDYTRMIEERTQTDQQLAETLKRLLQTCPAGRIQVTTAKGYPRYYWIKGGQRKYLRKEDLATAKELMQKSYYKDLLDGTNKELKLLHFFLDRFDPQALNRIYEEMHEVRKRFVEPLILSDDQYARQWLEEQRQKAAERPNRFPLSENYQTLNGEFVRSKSEKIILDLLKYNNVLYVYEAPLVLTDGLVYPDITALNVRLRKTMYWEHFGMMDDPDYANDALQKTDRYERSGYFIGDQLIVSMESSKHPLGMKSIERLIRQFLL